MYSHSGILLLQSSFSLSLLVSFLSVGLFSTTQTAYYQHFPNLITNHQLLICYTSIKDQDIKVFWCQSRVIALNLMDRRITLSLLHDAQWHSLWNYRHHKDNITFELSLGSHSHNNKVNLYYISCHYDRCSTILVQTAHLVALLQSNQTKSTWWVTQGSA